MFETYLVLDDETEYRVEVEATGQLIEDGFGHEFGYEPSNYIDGVVLDAIYNLETEEQVPIDSLTKKQKKVLLDIAFDYLNEDVIKYDHSEFEEDEYEQY